MQIIKTDTFHAAFHLRRFIFDLQRQKLYKGIKLTLRVKIGEWQAAARDFGIQRDSAREFIGTIDGKQPRGIFTTTSYDICQYHNTPDSIILR